MLWARLNTYSTQFRKQLKNICTKMLWNIVCVRARACAHACMCACSQMCACVHVCARLCVRACVRDSCACACVCVCVCVLRPRKFHVTKTNITVKFASHFALQRHHDVHYCTQLSPFHSKNKFCLVYIIIKKQDSSNISLTLHEQILRVVQNSLVRKLKVLPVSQ